MMIEERLAAFALAPVVAPDALTMMRLSLFDWAACGVAGAQEPVARILRDMALATGGAGQAGIFGSAQALPAAAAAMVNGATSHALDYDDTHFAHIGHPSVAVIPAALAMAQVQGLPGAEMIKAALVGAEASVRVGVWLGREHYQRGFHQTATAGAIGAALAAGRLAGLDPVQMRMAIGIAATRAAGLKAQFGTMGKPYHAGMAAETGVVAAQLAKAGFIAATDALSGPRGFAATHAGVWDLSALDGIGTDWLMLAVSHKLHACCHGLHATLNALADLDAANQPVARVEIATHPRWLSVCNIAAPDTGLAAKFSYAQVTAMALAGVNTAAIASFSDATANRDDLIAWRRKVTVTGDDGLPESAARVTLHLTDGTTRSTTHDLNAPMTVEDRTVRLHGKATALLGTDTAALVWQATNGPVAPDMDALRDLICAAG